MEIKKTERANLENKRGIFFEIGLIVSLALVFTAFQWKSPIQKTQVFEEPTPLEYTIEEAEVTRHSEPEVLEPPKPKVKLFDFINLVGDDEEIIEDAGILNLDDFAPEDLDFITEIEVIDEPTIFISVEKMPLFQGGDLNTFQKYVMAKVVYPQIAINNNVQGIVTITFVVNEKGKVVNVEAIGNADPVLKEEAIKAVKSSPIWTPGSHMMKNVKVQMSIPIVFRLN